MTVDLSKYDRPIIEKDRRYLYCVHDLRPEWHWSPYHAWWDRRRNGSARMVAKKLGGKVRIFNPITGDIR